MVIYCDTKGNAISVPSSIPFGSALIDITIIAPQTTAFITLKLKPPTGEYLPDIICSPHLDANGLVVYSAKLPKNAANMAGRCFYQVESTYSDGEKTPSYKGSFNITSGVLVDMPETVEQLKQHTIDELYQLLTNVATVYLEVSNIHQLIGIGEQLQTASKTILSAINEINKKIVDGEGGVKFKTDKTLTLKDEVLSVNFATTKDRTLAIKASDVDITVGNIDALLKTI